MSTFQRIVILVAAGILLVVLVFVGIALYRKPSAGPAWPPVVGDCPDYWVDTSAQADGSQCVNRHRLGKCNLPTASDPRAMNFNQAPFTSANGTCAKYRWAQACGVTWDGITSGVQNPCASSA